MTLEHLKEEAFGLGIREFYSFIRNKYLEKHGFETEAVDKEGIENVTRKISNFLGIEEDKLWEIREFHLGFRITDVDLLSELGIEDRLIEGAGKSVEKGRKLSILPLNVLLGGDTIKKFVPSLPELYEPEQCHPNYRDWVTGIS